LTGTPDELICRSAMVDLRLPLQRGLIRLGAVAGPIQSIDGEEQSKAGCRFQQACVRNRRHTEFVDLGQSTNPRRERIRPILLLVSARVMRRATLNWASRSSSQ
jgi:hypothetical protein